MSPLTGSGGSKSSDYETGQLNDIELEETASR